MDHAALSDALNTLFGDGAHELIAKMNPDGADLSAAAKRRKHEKRQAQVGLASNIVGIGAGAQGLYAANEDFKRKNAEAHGKTYTPKEGKVGRLKPVKAYKKWASKPKNALMLAGGAVALQGGNMVGDVVANRVLSREAKKDIKKGLSDLTPEGQIKQRLIDEDAQGMPLGAKGQLIRLSINNKDKIKSGSQKVVTVAGPKVKRGTEVAAETAHKAKEKYISKALDMSVTTEISKVNTDKRQVFGWASVVERDGVPVVDLQGDYISVEEVEKAAYEYVQKSRKGGNQHQRNGEEPLHVSDMIESFVVTPEKKEKLGLPDSVPTGWWVGFKINDDETWDQIKSGKRPQLSIHGRGKRQEI